MKKFSMTATTKVGAVVVGLAFATSMLTLAPIAQAASLTDSQIQSILSLLSSFGANSATIANVNAALTGTTAPATGGSTTTTTSSCSFTKDLTLQSSGADVTCLQQGLIAGGYSIPAGATGYFGSQTQAAVIAWQKANSVSPAAGYFGAISRAHWNLGGSTTGGTTGGTTTTPTGNGLKVALSATSPSGSVLVEGQGIGNLGEFVFSNPTAAPINVTGLTFKRIGVSNDATLTNVYLYNGVIRITDSAGVSNSQFSYNDPTALFTVPAGGVYVVAVRSDIAASTSGQQIGVSLVSATSNGTLDSSVSFPINSGYQTISAASLASVDYGVNPQPTGAPSISPQNDYPVWQDTISVSTNAVKLSSIKFTNIGSIDSANLINLRLFVDGVQVGSTVPTMGADRTITFDLSAAPAVFSTQSHVVKVLANITGGAGKTIVFSVQRSSDAMFVDSQLNQPVVPTYNSASFSAVTTSIVTVNSVGATSGVSVSLSPTSPNQTVAVGASSVKWASFSMLASGENVKVSDLYVYADTSAHNGGLDNGKVFLNGVQVGSTKDIGELAANATDFSLGSSLILPAGQTVTVDIYADAKTSTSTNLSNNETVTVGLKYVASNAQGQSSLSSTAVPAADTNGNTITVSSSSLTANKYSGYGNQTMIAGALAAKLGVFTLSTGSTEGVTVNTINFSLSEANAASLTNLLLKDAATGNQLGTIISTPSTSNSYSVSIDIPASSTKTIEIIGNILSGANAGTIAATITTSTSGTGNLTGISTSAASTELQTITVGSGSITATTGAGDPTSANVIAGASSVKVGQFNFSASNSAFTVQNLAILVPNAAATSVTNVTISYKDSSGTTQTATQPLAVTAANAYATATFTGLSMYVPANDSANLDVSVGIPSIASGATSGAAIKVYLDRGGASGGNSTLRAINSAGTATTYLTTATPLANTGTFYVRKSAPTFAVPAGQGGSITPVNPIYRFTVSADPAGAIEWSKLVFTVATTSATLTNVYLIEEGSGNNVVDNTTTSASTTATSVTVDLTLNGTQPTYQQVAAGATKTYALYGTVTGFTTGSSLSIYLAQDSSPVANGTADATDKVSANTIWSDRSAGTHTISTSDWTSGYLVKNFTTNSVSYSK